MQLTTILWNSARDALLFQSHNAKFFAPISLAEAGRQCFFIIIGGAVMLMLVLILAQISNTLELCLLELDCVAERRAIQLIGAGANLLASMWFFLLIGIGLPRLIFRAIRNQCLHRFS